MRYRFDVYHYGPYCDRISRDVEWLLADDVLKDASSAPEKYSNYHHNTNTEELLQPHGLTLNRYQEKINKVVWSLLPLQPQHLELLATLAYLYRQLKAGGGPGPWKDRVIDRFLQVKKDKFASQIVSTTYDVMVDAEIIEA
jgi:hypothetical protein